MKPIPDMQSPRGLQEPPTEAGGDLRAILDPNPRGAADMVPTPPARQETHDLTLHAESHTAIYKIARSPTKQRQSHLAKTPSRNAERPSETLERFAHSLEPRHRIIYDERIAANPSLRTLREIADDFGLTHERVRQIESSVEGLIAILLASDEGRNLRQHIETLRSSVGAAAPTERVMDMLGDPVGVSSHHTTILRLAGPYKTLGSWHVRADAVSKNPTNAIAHSTAPMTPIDRDRAKELLEEWGLDPKLHTDWMLNDSRLRMIDGVIVKWSRKTADRAAFALDRIGAPTTAAAIAEYTGEKTAHRTIASAMRSDARFSRVSHDHWTLAEWGMAPYDGISKSMKNLLLAHGPSMSAHRMIDLMARLHGTKDATVKSYFSAPMFIARSGRIRLRRPEDGPYRSSGGDIARARGIFKLGKSRVAIVKRITETIHAGSGSGLTHAAGGILGIPVGATTTFAGVSGDSVTITYPETSTMGPHIGSIRTIALRRRARPGDLLTLVLDASDMTVESRITRPQNASASWKTVSALTGIDRANREKLARATGCDASRIAAELAKRGDTELATLIPAADSRVA